MVPCGVSVTNKFVSQFIERKVHPGAKWLRRFIIYLQHSGWSQCEMNVIILFRANSTKNNYSNAAFITAFSQLPAHILVL